MTALKKYQRLECQGLWREAPEAKRRDVIVSFRDATLILSDSRSEMPLSHWSLPAVERMNPGEMPALYRPGADAAEELELDDPVMIEALATVYHAVEAQRPHPGRMRNWLLFGALAAVLAAAGLWLPGALITHTARVVPWVKRVEIGRAVLADLEHVTGSPCAAPEPSRILNRLSSRLFGANPPVIEVMRTTPVPATYLPGGILMLDSRLIENRDGPDVAAGYLLAEQARAKAEDPLLPLLRWVGLKASFTLLTTGDLPEGALNGYGESLLRKPQPEPPAPALLEWFRRAGVPTTPYAEAVGTADPAMAALKAADPFAHAPIQRLMSDDDWVALQGICTP